MPELPEVEVVRRGLEKHLVGLHFTEVEVLDSRPLRRHVGGPASFVDQLVGRQVQAAVRRGKFLWLVLDDGAALTAHLGMSGQLLVHSGLEAEHFNHRHLRVRLRLEGSTVLHHVDQRMFGGLAVVDMVPTSDGFPGGCGSQLNAIPVTDTHVARDVLDPYLDKAQVIGRLQASSRAIKTQLLDQGVISGIGNIYADEALWAARIAGARPGSSLSKAKLKLLLQSTGEVMQRALAQGGTSFDALYVNTEGEAGYFARLLEVYGREGQPCSRCGRLLRKEVIGGRSHVRCPNCQRNKQG